MEDIEIHFRLDENGRTVAAEAEAVRDDDDDDGEGGANDDDGEGGANDVRPTPPSLDYSPKVTMTDLDGTAAAAAAATTVVTPPPPPDAAAGVIDELLFDCEIADCGLMPRTYWVPAAGGMAPRFALEQFAMDVFHHHVPADLGYDRDRSGAEWWCQLRPSPEGTGRYSMHGPSKEDDDDIDGNDDDESNGDDENGASREDKMDPFAWGISMHVDKDEELRILTGGTTYIHPHLSTVTYLTSLGSPTLILDCRVEPLTGKWIVPGHTVRGFVSWPSVGKHTSFDGRFLHASPTDLMEDGAFEEQVRFSPDPDDDERGIKVQKRRHRRVTFLVNIWLNYRPLDVHPYPETMVDKMSGRDEATRQKLRFLPPPTGAAASGALHMRHASVRAGEATERRPPPTVAGNEGGHENDETASTTSVVSNANNVYPTETFTWALGDRRSGETLALHVPLRSIREAAAGGGNAKIEWHRSSSSSPASGNGGRGDDNDCFRLVEGKRQPERQHDGTASTKRGADEMSADPLGPTAAAAATDKHQKVD